MQIIICALLTTHYEQELDVILEVYPNFKLTIVLISVIFTFYYGELILYNSKKFKN